MRAFFESIAAKGPLFCAGQILGIFIIAWSFLIYLQRDRNRILIFKFCGDMFSVVQYALCSAPAGAVLNVIMGCREIIFFHRGKRRWANSIAWLFVFMALIFLSPFVTSKEPVFSALWLLNLLPACGSVLGVIGLYAKNPTLTRLLSLGGIICWLIYVTLLQNWIQIVSNVISICSILVGLLGDYIRYRKKKAASGDAASAGTDQAEE